MARSGLEILQARPIFPHMIAVLRAYLAFARGRRAAGLIAWSVLLAVGLLAACTRSTPEAAREPAIRLGTYEWPGSYWINVAWKKGWFKEAGLNVERVDVDGKYFASLDEVAAGKIDGMGFTQFDLVRSVAQGHDLVGVAAIDYSDGAEALVARPGFTRLRDLKGKRIALYRGTYLEYLLTVIAERENVDLSTITLVDRSTDDAIADLKAGRVEAALLWEPYTTRALEAVNGTRLFSTAEFPGLTYSVLTFRRDFVRAHPAQIDALLRVWVDTVRYIREHPDETAEIVAELQNEEVAGAKDLMRTDRILDIADNNRAFSYAAGFESLHGSWRRMIDFQIERGLAVRRVDSPDHLDSRFIRALE